MLSEDRNEYELRVGRFCKIAPHDFDLLNIGNKKPHAKTLRRQGGTS